MNIDDLLPFYALDALTDEERTFVESYLAEHPEMLAEINEMNAVVDTLPRAIEPIVPSAPIKANLMQRIAAHPRAQLATEAEEAAAPVAQAAPLRKSFWERIGLQSPWPAATVLGFAMAAIMLIYALNVRGNLRTLNSEVAALQNSVAQLQDENAALALAADEAETLRANVVELEAATATLAADNATLSTVNGELQRQLEQDAMLLAIYTSPSLQTAEIAGIEDVSEASGLLVVDPDSAMGVLSLMGLETLSAENTYQFWLINLDEEAFISAGVFESDDLGNSRYVFDVASLDPYNAIGVSIEPTGGSEAPTNVVMLAELDS